MSAAMTESAQAKARQLLDAHVNFWLQELAPDRLAAIVREEITYLYGELDRISLNEAVSAAKIRATAHRYALEMEIGGAIPELFGEIANLVYEHPAQYDTRVSDIFPAASPRNSSKKFSNPAACWTRPCARFSRATRSRYFWQMSCCWR